MKYLNCGGEKTGRGRFVSRPYAGAGWAGAAGGLVSDVAQPKAIPYEVGDGGGSSYGSPARTIRSRAKQAQAKSKGSGIRGPSSTSKASYRMEWKMASPTTRT